MIPRALFDRYTEERRSVVPAGFRKDAVDGLTRFTPLIPALGGVVMFSELSAGMIDDAISAQVNYFREIGRDFEWKIYDFDAPADLAVRLKARGFERGEAEAFLVYPVAGHRPRPRNSEVRIERVTSDAGIRDVVAIQEQVWNQSFQWLEPSLRMSQESSAIYCAYCGDKAVGTGWIEFPEGTAFADLHGGSVLPALRGRGIYSALFDARIHEARRRGFEYIAVDAAPMSRPILLQKGFTYICDTVPFHRVLDANVP